MKILKTFFGLSGGIGTTFSFLPQVLHIYQKESIEGLSPYLLIIHFLGVSSWIAYGVMQKDRIIILFNVIAEILVSAILVKYFRITRSSL